MTGDHGFGLIDAAHLGQVVLLVVAIVASTRHKRHLLLATWLGVGVVYALLNVLWITPVLSHLPRPFHGTARLGMHLAQALYLASMSGFALVVWSAFRVPTRWYPLPVFIAFCTLVMLVDGYGRGPAVGLFRVGPLVFRSSTAYLVAGLLTSIVTWIPLVPRVARVLLEPEDVHDTALALATLSMEILGDLRLAIPYIRAPWAVSANAGLVLIAYVLALAVYASLLFAPLRRRWAHFVEHDLLVARRRRAMERIHTRLADMRGRARDGAPLGSVGPYLEELCRRVGRDREVERLALVDRQAIRNLELVAAVTGTLRDADAITVLEQARNTLGAAGHLGADWSIRWEDLLANRDALSQNPLLAPVTLMLLSALQGVRKGAAQSALDLASTLHHDALPAASAPRVALGR